MDIHKNFFIIVILLVAAVLGLLVWYFQWGLAPAQGPVESVPAPSPVAEETLGGEIFEKAQNPVADKLTAPNPADAINPLEGVYKNPFE
jgi:hypothetical protein